MKPLRKTLLILVIIIMAVSLCSFGNSSPKSSSNSSTTPLLSNYQEDIAHLAFNNSAWHYDQVNNVYWQIGVQYCTKPETTEYETMAIYVPGEYLTAVANGDGTYTCTLNANREVNGYSVKTAPVVFPVNTPGYSGQASATTYDYNSISSYIKAGFIYVYAGMRGRNNGYDKNGTLIYSGGAPWGVTDLKAAVRYYRFNQNVLPGNTDRIFSFGMSGGGAQSAIMGASGDSKLFYPYLESIGAAMLDKNGKYISDAIYGAMCWCPITSLDYADEAYEWNMGQYFSTGSRGNNTWTSLLSIDLAKAYASYINKLDLKDKKGKILTLNNSTNGIYASGTYYDYILSIIEGSLNNFLSYTTFPYTKTSGGFMPEGGIGRGAPNGMPPDGNVPGNNAPGGNIGQPSQATSATYKTAQDYIDSLNSDIEWVKYDPKTNTAKITSIEAFVKHCKNASKSVPAFDSLTRNQAENDVFGNDTYDALHFDGVVANLLVKNKVNYSAYSDWNSSIVGAYSTDLKSVDKFGNSIQYRGNMYNPMYYLLNYYEGFNTSMPAPHWRIRTGIEQGDTAITVEANLAQALENYAGVKDVDFETIWGLGHTTAEQTGNSTDNFIAWVNKCVGKK